MKELPSCVDEDAQPSEGDEQVVKAVLLLELLCCAAQAGEAPGVYLHLQGLGQFLDIRFEEVYLLVLKEVVLLRVY
jgi:hypothetical protein